MSGLDNGALNRAATGMQSDPNSPSALRVCLLEIIAEAFSLAGSQHAFPKELRANRTLNSHFRKSHRLSYSVRQMEQLVRHRASRIFVWSAETHEYEQQKKVTTDCC